MRLQKAKTIFKGNFSFIEDLPYKLHTDRDLVNVEAIAVKSCTGNLYDFYRDGDIENPLNYKYTAIALIPQIKNFINAFKVETTRVRIHKQKPGAKTDLHIDLQNVYEKDKNQSLRVFTALNSDSNFLYDFKLYNSENVISISLEKGESVIFDPDYVFHGTRNLSDNKDRYTLVSIVKPNDWLIKFIKESDVIEL